MNGPLINILIRVHESRQDSYTDALGSIKTQTYKNVNVIACYDFPMEKWSIQQSDNDFRVIPNKELGPFFYNDYCNFLKSKVQEGWFFFLDSDDYLANNTVLEEIAKHLTGNAWQAVVCQMSRDNGKVKPSDEHIASKSVESGKIGLPCLFLRSHYKDSLKIGVTENADYLFIKAITESVSTKFVKQIVVHSPKRNFGL